MQEFENAYAVLRIDAFAGQFIFALRGPSEIPEGPQLLHRAPVRRRGLDFLPRASGGGIEFRFEVPGFRCVSRNHIRDFSRVLRQVVKLGSWRADELPAI